MTKYRVKHDVGGTFIESDRGMVAQLIAGYQLTRDQDAKKIVDALNALNAKKEAIQ